MLEQKRCDFTYTWQDPDVGAEYDTMVTACTTRLSVPSSDPEKEFYCPLDDKFDDETRWGTCNSGCFEEDGGRISLNNIITKII